MRFTVATLLALGRVVAAEPDLLSVDLAEEMGILSSTRTTITAGHAHRLWDDRAFIEVRLGTGRSIGLTVLDARAGAGLVLNRDERVEVLVGWRVGDSHLFGHIVRNTGARASDDRFHALAITVADQPERTTCEVGASIRRRRARREGP